jgi:NAD(P)-dependent dehydrogenase (short-subunit alcohol dehydrogenase family)
MATKQDLDDTVRQVEALGQRMLGCVTDVRDREAVEGAYAAGLAEFGRVDFIVANAGIMPIWGRYADTAAAWQDCLDVMLTGVMHVVEAGWPRLVDQGTGGSIVITSSIGAVRPMMRTLGGRTLGMLGYCAVKGGLVTLMENYASILAPHNIRVNTVHPTGVNTPMVDNDMVRDRFANANEEDLKALVNAIPVDMVESEDIADAVAWLCSDESKFYTGQAMRIDAGAALR